MRTVAAARRACRHDEIAEGRADDLAPRAAPKRRTDFLKHRDAFFRRKQRRLAGMNAHRKDQPVGKPYGAFDDVEMTVGDGVERPGKKRCARHGRGSSPRSSQPQGGWHEC